MCDFTTKERLVEILNFQAFADYYRFLKVDENSRLRVLENKILVSVCTDIRIKKYMTKSLINIIKKEF